MQSGAAGGAAGTGGGEEELLSKLSEQLAGLDNDPNMQGKQVAPELRGCCCTCRSMRVVYVLASICAPLVAH
jgi:hypothetical protein